MGTSRIIKLTEDLFIFINLNPFCKLNQNQQSYICMPSSLHFLFIINQLIVLSHTTNKSDLFIFYFLNKNSFFIANCRLFLALIYIYQKIRRRSTFDCTSFSLKNKISLFLFEYVLWISIIYYFPIVFVLIKVNLLPSELYMCVHR